LIFKFTELNFTEFQQMIEVIGYIAAACATMKTLTDFIKGRNSL